MTTNYPKQSISAAPTDARETVLKDIRKSINDFNQSKFAHQAGDAERPDSTLFPRPVVDEILIDRFVAKLEAVNGTIDLVNSYEEVPPAVEQYLKDQNLSTELLMNDSEFLNRFDWPNSWQIHHRTATKHDKVSLTDAACAIAETGTIVCTSSPSSSSTCLFLPDNHIVVFTAGQLVRHLEDAVELLSEETFKNSRGIHMITGPSKTADVEQTIQYGAHGPRRLHAIVICSS